MDRFIDIMNKRIQLISACLIAVIMLIAILFCCKKQGYYIDEYYLYTLANGTQLGVSVTPGEWNDTSEYIHQLVSEGDENFSFGQMYRATENNVHPFLYYALVHLVSSFVPGVFSKWIGLSINLCLFIVTLILVKKLAWRISGGNSVVILLTIILYGLSPATISMVVLIRMYLLLSLWTLLLAYIHVCDLEREKLSVKSFLLPLFICGFCGFLTQYFFVIVLFFFTLVYGFYLAVFRRRIKDALLYGFTVLFSLICTYFVWPISYFHIFKGYRGKGAASQLMEISKIGVRIWTNFQYINDMVFGGLLPFFLLLFVIGVIVLIRKCFLLHKVGKKPLMDLLSVQARAFILLLIVSMLTYAVLTQVGLTDNIYCMRQYYMAYSLFLILIPVGAYKLTALISGDRKWISGVVTSLLIGIALLLGHIQKGVLFLYEDDQVIKEFAIDHPDAKPVMFTTDDGNYDSRLQDLIMYPEFYFVSLDDLSTAEDDTIANSDELLVYIRKNGESEKQFDSLYSRNTKLKQCDFLTDCDFFEVYYMHR